MTDPKRITLPGPGSQPSHPAPEPPAEVTATAVLGTLPSGTPVERSVPLLPAVDDDEEEEKRPGFNPFKFQRITVPPGLRADMIRWSREGKAEQPPEDTRDDESNLESSSAESEEDDPGSVMPVGGSGAPRLPLRSVRGVALAAFLVILPLAVLGLASAMRRPPSESVRAPAAEAQDLGTKPEAASAALPVTTADETSSALAAQPAAPAPTALAPTPAETGVATPSAVPRPAPIVSPRVTTPKRTGAEPARPIRSAEPASGAMTKENALDRPFSLPK